jgi:hypothetical protein
MEELDCSENTARRWINCFSARLDIRVERGIVLIGQED